MKRDIKKEHTIQRVLDVVASTNGIDCQEIAEKLKLTPHWVKKALNTLIERDEIFKGVIKVNGTRPRSAEGILRPGYYFQI